MATTVNVAQFEDSFVIHFGGEFKRINAYTLASTLINFADAAKAANASLNPGYQIEVVVEALGSGSFKAKVRTLYKGASNLFSKENVKTIVLSIIAAYVYQHTLAPDIKISVNVGDSEVVIEQGDTRIVVPKDIHDSLRQIERSPQFRKGVGQAMRAVEEDPDITSIGLSKEMSDRRPVLEIPKERFAVLTRPTELEDDNERVLEEITDVEILRAILERSRRRWEFVWNGMKIPAPVLDDQFYNDFFDHKITVAPGDALRVRLRVPQKRHSDFGVFINHSYEVVEVLKHLPRATQGQLNLIHKKKGGT